MAKISVMGTGSWGTALAILLHNNGHQVILWSAHPDKAASLSKTREDAAKLPGIKIPEEMIRKHWNLRRWQFLHRHLPISVR